MNKIHGIGFHLTVLVILHQQIIENKDKSKFIKAQCGKFYQVRYEFQYEKGGTTHKALPAMCGKKDLEEHFLYF